jgi:hypothetical protein
VYRVESVAEVDVVVLVLGVDPFFLKVVDEEMDIFRDQGGLDGRQVNAREGALRVSISDCR